MHQKDEIYALKNERLSLLDENVNLKIKFDEIVSFIQVINQFMISQRYDSFIHAFELLSSL